MQTTQSGSATARSGEGRGTELKMKRDQKKGLWNWLFGKKDEEAEEQEKHFKGAQQSTIPDFTAHFQNQHYAQQAMGAVPQTPTARSDVRGRGRESTRLFAVVELIEALEKGWGSGMEFA